MSGTLPVFGCSPVIPNMSAQQPHVALLATLLSAQSTILLAFKAVAPASQSYKVTRDQRWSEYAEVSHCRMAGGVEELHCLISIQQHTAHC